MRFAHTSFFTLVPAVLAVVQLQARAVSTNDSGIEVPKDFQFPGWTAIDAASPPSAVTNAERFVRGLSPLKPRAYRRDSQHGTRVQMAPRAQQSAHPPVSVKCNILVKSYGQTLGFLLPAFNSFGAYKSAFQRGQAGALVVSFSYQPGSRTPINMLATNGPTSTYPYFGGVVGAASASDNLASGSFNYAYLAGVKQHASGPSTTRGGNSINAAAHVAKDDESAMWIYDPVSKGISAQWINKGGSTPATHILHEPSKDYFVVTGDTQAFQKSFHTNAFELSFTCVPPPKAY